MVTLTITGETMAEVFAKLKDYAPAHIPQAPVNPTPAPAGIPAYTSYQAAPSAQVTPAPAQTPAPPVGQMAPAPAQTPVTAAPTYTHEQVGKAGADLVAASPAKPTKPR